MLCAAIRCSGHLRRAEFANGPGRMGCADFVRRPSEHGGSSSCVYGHSQGFGMEETGANEGAKRAAHRKVRAAGYSEDSTEKTSKVRIQPGGSLRLGRKEGGRVQGKARAAAASLATAFR